MKRILSLDLGTKTGYCVFEYDFNTIKSGTINFGIKRGEHLGKRFFLFRRWLLDAINNYDIERIVYEAVYAHSGIELAHVYGGFLYIMQELAYGLTIDTISMGVGTIKLKATGNGRASKEEVIKSMRLLGHNPIDDNEADAVAIMVAYKKLLEKDNKKPAAIIAR